MFHPGSAAFQLDFSPALPRFPQLSVFMGEYHHHFAPGLMAVGPIQLTCSAAGQAQARYGGIAHMFLYVLQRNQGC